MEDFHQTLNKKTQIHIAFFFIFPFSFSELEHYEYTVCVLCKEQNVKHG